MPDDTREQIPIIHKFQGIVTYGKNMIRHIKKRSWIVKEIGLSEGAIFMVAGYGGSNKSFFVQWLLLHISNGLPLFGQFPVKHLMCMHIDLEMGEDETLRRYQRMAASINVNLEESRLKIVNNSFNYSHKNWKEQFREMLSKYPCAVLAIDSVRAFTIGVKENAAESGDALHQILTICREHNVTLILIHHEPKPTKESETHSNQQKIRGHSSIGDALDNSIRLIGGAKGVPTIVSKGKDRHGSCMDDFAFVVKDHGDRLVDDDCPISLEIVSEAEMRHQKDNAVVDIMAQVIERIRNFLTSRENCTFVGSQEEMRAAMNIKKPTLTMALKLLEERGMIVRVISSRETKWIA